MIISFVCFLTLFVAVGVASMRYSRKTTEDYLTASQSIKPWLAGLSAFATENSGFMFIGYIGLVYALGLSALWIVGGWYLGEAVMMWFAGHRLRAKNESVQAQTYSGLISNWGAQEYKIVRILSAVIISIFLAVYAAAQFSAGGKALNVLAGWDLNFSAAIGFVIVLLYCMAGGIRATIWTDAVQAIVMFGSLALITVFSLNEIGGIGTMISSLNAMDPAYLDPFAGSYQFGLIGFISGWLFAGMGVLGQAHVMVRFLVLDKAESAKQATLYYVGMVTILSVLCTTAGLCARIILPELSAEGADAELALPMISAQLMPGVLSGLFLAGLFAAAMSSADSQILASSAALTRDIVPKYRDNVWWSKAGTIVVAALALGIALLGNKNVFSLATYAWAVMAAGLGPLIFVQLLGRQPAQIHALIMMVGGILAALAWDHYGLGSDLYNVAPGVVTGLALYFIPAAVMGAGRKVAPESAE